MLGTMSIATHIAALAVAVTMGAATARAADHCADLRACETACNAGDGAACDRLGQLHADGEGTRVDHFKSAAAYSKACEKQQGHACYELARCLDERRIRMPRPEEAAILYGRGCDYGDFKACDAAASTYGTSPDKGAAELAARYAHRKAEL